MWSGMGMGGGIRMAEVESGGGGGEEEKRREGVSAKIFLDLGP